MKVQKNIWIYCRVDDSRKEELLEFQADLLSDFAHKNNYSIVGLTKSVDFGRSMNSVSLKTLIDQVINEFVDGILVYSKSRLLIDNELFDELELICLMHGVSIITFKHD